MKFKNDKERLAFLDDYRNTSAGWYKWKEIDDIDRVFWRFDLFTCSFVVEEQLMTLRYPNVREDWRLLHWYIVEDWRKPFADSVAHSPEDGQDRTGRKSYAKDFGGMHGRVSRRGSRFGSQP